MKYLRNSLTLFFIFMLLSSLVFASLFSSKELTFSLDQKEYYFNTGENAILTLYTDNTYNKNLEGMLTYSIIQSINQAGMHMSSTNTQSTNMIIEKGSSALNLNFGTSKNPVDLNVNLKFIYNDGDKQKIVELENIIIHFVNNNQNNNNNNNNQNGNQKSGESNGTDNKNSNNMNSNQKSSESDGTNNKNSNNMNSNQKNSEGGDSNNKNSNNMNSKNSDKNNYGKTNTNSGQKVVAKSKEYNPNNRNSNNGNSMNSNDPFWQMQNQFNQMMQNMQQNNFNNQNNNYNQNSKQALQNNQMRQDSSALKKEMERDLRKQEEMKKSFQKEIAKNTEFQKEHQKLINEGYNITDTQFNPTNNNTGDFKIEYKDKNGQKASLSGDMNNGSLNNLQKDTPETRQKILNNIKQNKKFKKYDEELKKKGFRPTEVKFDQGINKTNVRLNYINKDNETAQIDAKVVNEKIEKIELKSKLEDTKNGVLKFVVYFILLLIVTIFGIYLFNKHFKKKEVVETEKKLFIKPKPIFDYRNESYLLLNEAKKLFSENKIKDAYEKLSQSLRLFFSYKYGLNKETTSKELLDFLKNKNLTKDVERFENILEKCKLVEFAKGKGNENEFDEFCRIVEKVLK